MPFSPRFETDITLTPYPPADKKDPVAYANFREQRAREVSIAIETGKILKERLAECYEKEGVNHGQNCKEIADRYKAWIEKPYYGALRGDEE